jgi:hypothetical protein
MRDPNIKPLNFRAAMDAIKIHQSISSKASFEAEASSTPRRIFQYWDREPPGQIRQLLKHNQELCRKHNVEYVLFDDHGARALIEENFDPSILQAYDVAAHPAMKCDIFRYCYLIKAGGFYVDADMALRDSYTKLFDLCGKLIVFQWDSRNVENICNWLIGATPNDPILSYALRQISHNISTACSADPKKALENVLAVSGPVAFSRCIGTYLASIDPATVDSSSSSAIHFSTVSQAYKFVMNGPQFLKVPLDYKSTELHWWVAKGNAPQPQAVAPVAQKWRFWHWWKK